MLEVSKVFIWAGLVLLIFSIFFRQLLFLLPNIGIALLWAGLILQYYHFWRTGQKEKLRELGFRFLVLFAIVGLLFTLSVLLKW